MSKIGLMHYADGSEMTDPDYYRGRIVGRSPREVSLSKEYLDGEIVQVHMGHGRYQDFTVLAQDARKAILVSTW